MIEYLRDLVSKSKPGEKYGKFVSLFYFIFLCHQRTFPLEYLDADNPVTGSYALQFADDFKYTDPVSFNIIYHYYPNLLSLLKMFNSCFILLPRLMGALCQSKVFGLFSQMDRGLYIDYQYVPNSHTHSLVIILRIHLLSGMFFFFFFFKYQQGTGSAGATVRVYIEQFEPDVSKHDVDAQTALKPLIG